MGANFSYLYCVKLQILRQFLQMIYTFYEHVNVIKFIRKKLIKSIKHLLFFFLEFYLEDFVLIF